ncbi:hypothetical protein SAMN05421856_101431 [Chryseobacterium taichungense]|uniref:Uncharacterized protein n=1 Tax=Chryseobacterium taichungense TaxID=295069 RepID=A0A1H7W2X3_9FLAO|nr:hypothetical protein SAMN05421856_101431 [Chryseobacterium taichungense]
MYEINIYTILGSIIIGAVMGLIVKYNLSKKN